MAYRNRFLHRGIRQRKRLRVFLLHRKNNCSYAVRDELQKRINEFYVVGGAAVVMNISNGEIISLVSLPEFEPNNKSAPNDKCLFNMVTSSAIEPKSSSKIFKKSMAFKRVKLHYLLNLMQGFL